MQIKLNKKQNILTLAEKVDRKEYVINILLDGADISNPKKSLETLAKLKGQAIVIPGQTVLENDASVPEYMYLVGKLLKEFDKVLIVNGGTYGIDDVQIQAFGRGVRFLKVNFGNIVVALILDQDLTQELKTSDIPEDLLDADIMMASVTRAPALVSMEYPVFVFWGDKGTFVQSTGIEQVQQKESISIRNIDRVNTGRTIYILQ